MKASFVFIFLIIFSSDISAKTFRSDKIFVLADNREEAQVKIKGICGRNNVGCILSESLILKDSILFIVDGKNYLPIGTVLKDRNPNDNLESMSIYNTYSVSAPEVDILFKTKIRTSILPRNVSNDLPVPSTFMCVPLPRGVVMLLSGWQKLNQFKRYRKLTQELILKSDKQVIKLKGSIKKYGEINRKVSFVSEVEFAEL